MGNIKKLTNGIKEYFKTYGNRNQLIVVKLRKDWEKIVGKANANHSIPSKLLNKKLIIDVNDNIWVQELSLKADEIINLINEDLKKKIVEKLHFRFRYFTKSDDKKNEEKTEEYSIPGEKLKKIENILSNIEDKKLREALKHYFIQTICKD